MQWGYTKLMARKRSQWPARPRRWKGRCLPIPSRRCLPIRCPRRTEPETDYDAIPAEHREFARFVDAAMEPDKHDPYIFFSYLKQLESPRRPTPSSPRKRWPKRRRRRCRPRCRSPPSRSVPLRQFQGNRRARKAAARKARKSG